METEFEIKKSHIHYSSQVVVDQHFLTLPKQLSMGLVCGKYLTGQLGFCCSNLLNQEVT